MRSPKTPLRGDRPGSERVLCYEVMRLRFLVAGLAGFVLVILLAVLPVVAQAVTPSSPCTIKGTNGANLLMGTAAADVICGYGGNDTITAKGGNDVVRGGDGADVIYGDTGRDWLFGGPGNDRIYARDSQQDRVNGGTGFDYARVDNPLDILRYVESH
jgi:Ca2+-binding RTX toxin-like protein